MKYNIVLFIWFSDGLIFFTYIYTGILFLYLRVLQKSTETTQNYLKRLKKTKSIMVDVWEKSGDPKDCKAFHADPHTHEPSDKNNGSNDKLNEVLEWH